MYSRIIWIKYNIVNDSKIISGPCQNLGRTLNNMPRSWQTYVDCNVNVNLKSRQENGKNGKIMAKSFQNLFWGGPIMYRILEDLGKMFVVLPRKS